MRNIHQPFEQNGSSQSISFKSIDHGVKAFDILSLASDGAEQTTETRTQRLVTYEAARPIIVALSSVLLIPPTWRALLAVFVA